MRILELLERVRAQHDLGILLISHNLGVVARLCPESLVLYRARWSSPGPRRSCWPRRATLHRCASAKRAGIGVPFRVPSRDRPSTRAGASTR
ncbi:MAG: hypothetical protein U0869_06075 [Chloroflexota bacterium]